MLNADLLNAWNELDNASLVTTLKEVFEINAETRKIALAEALITIEDLKNTNKSVEYNRGVCTAFDAIRSLLEDTA